MWAKESVRLPAAPRRVVPLPAPLWHQSPFPPIITYPSAAQESLFMVHPITPPGREAQNIRTRNSAVSLRRGCGRWRILPSVTPAMGGGQSPPRRGMSSPSIFTTPLFLSRNIPARQNFPLPAKPTGVTLSRETWKSYPAHCQFRFLLPEQ